MDNTTNAKTRVHDNILNQDMSDFYKLFNGADIIYGSPFQYVTLKTPLRDIQAPINHGDGQWVKPKAFTGNKSFGLFACCDRTWSCAHARKNFKQKCRQCQKQCEPFAMWALAF